MQRIAVWAALALMAAVTPALAQQPTQAQVTAIKQACRGDYQSYCASIPTGGSAALQCLQSNVASLSAQCQQALSAMNGGASPGMASPSAGNAPPPMSTPPQGAPYQPAPAPMSRRQQMMALRTDCGPDFRRLCYGIQPGGGRAVACLYAHGPQLSEVCRAALQGR
jgi:hypothetical protein